LLYNTSNVMMIMHRSLIAKYTLATKQVITIKLNILYSVSVWNNVMLFRLSRNIHLSAVT